MKEIFNRMGRRFADPKYGNARLMVIRNANETLLSFVCVEIENSDESKLSIKVLTSWFYLLDYDIIETDGIELRLYSFSSSLARHSDRLQDLAKLLKSEDFYVIEFDEWKENLKIQSSEVSFKLPLSKFDTTIPSTLKLLKTTADNIDQHLLAYLHKLN